MVIYPGPSRATREDILLPSRSRKPLLAKGHQRSNEAGWKMSGRDRSTVNPRYSPENTENAVVQVDQTNIRRRDPDVEEVDDELVAHLLPSGLETTKLVVPFCLEALLRPRLALELFDLICEAASLEKPVYNAEDDSGEPELHNTLVELLCGRWC